MFLAEHSFVKSDHKLCQLPELKPEVQQKPEVFHFGIFSEVGDQQSLALKSKQLQMHILFSLWFSHSSWALVKYLKMVRSTPHSVMFLSLSDDVFCLLCCKDQWIQNQLVVVASTPKGPLERCGEAGGVPAWMGTRICSCCTIASPAHHTAAKTGDLGHQAPRLCFDKSTHLLRRA